MQANLEKKNANKTNLIEDFGTELFYNYFWNVLEEKQ